ncbi:MAG: tRNA (adenosine(37)-N6)-dimethylallyltransferase MiaA [Proteobacteria bacterium]|nr:tRNA (adenosine(37)-N6)-dimethylallyltransferase MiaA [Pseudomonadota bacterium]
MTTILISGPTASGKSALALLLARHVGGVIINADSMQVYGDLRIVTARPSAQDEAAAPHLLYGHVDAGENYSVGRYLADAAGALAEIRRRALVAIVVGGSGLYFKALTRGLANVPPVAADIRAAVRARLDAQGAAALHAQLARRDPDAAARLKPNDRSRVARALEVIEATGRPLSAWQRDGMAALIDPATCVKLFLAPERAQLRARIAARLDAMLAAGALEEIRALAARNLDPQLPAMKAHGVPWFLRHLRGEITLAAARAGACNDTCRYVKRQFTWFRHQLTDWPSMPPAAAFEALTRMPAIARLRQ